MVQAPGRARTQEECFLAASLHLHSGKLCTAVDCFDLQVCSTFSSSRDECAKEVPVPECMQSRVCWRGLASGVCF